MTVMWTQIGEEIHIRYVYTYVIISDTKENWNKEIKSRRGGRQFRKDQGSKAKIIFIRKIKVWTKYSKKNFQMKTSDKNAIGMARGVGEQSAQGKTWRNSITQ